MCKPFSFQCAERLLCSRSVQETLHGHLSSIPRWHSILSHSGQGPPRDQLVHYSAVILHTCQKGESSTGNGFEVQVQNMWTTCIYREKYIGISYRHRNHLWRETLETGDNGCLWGGDLGGCQAAVGGRSFTTCPVPCLNFFYHVQILALLILRVSGSYPS